MTDTENAEDGRTGTPGEKPADRGPAATVQEETGTDELSRLRNEATAGKLHPTGRTLLKYLEAREDLKAKLGEVSGQIKKARGQYSDHQRAEQAVEDAKSGAILRNLATQQGITVEQLVANLAAGSGSGGRPS